LKGVIYIDISRFGNVGHILNRGDCSEEGVCFRGVAESNNTIQITGIHSITIKSTSQRTNK